MKDKIFNGIIIVSDMDGTFLGEGGRVVKRNLEAIDYFKQKGGYFTFATGRTHHNIAKCIGDVSSLVNIPVITVNGACIYDFAKEKTVYENKIDVNDAVELISYCRRRFDEVYVRCSTEYGFLTDRAEGPVKRDIEHFLSGDNCGIAKETELSSWNGENIYKIVFRGEQDSLVNIRENIEDKFSDTFTFATSSPYFLELNAKNCSKALGVGILRDMYAKEKDSCVYCVGDYENDIEMLLASDVAACPENALDDVKRICNIMLCHHKDGAIADLIYKIESSI